eukprot:CAMPEP_0115615726 /NCGR_PEP_ID=MMETSP0272-20121206/22767_1 /TAXON_ID=71861 /ORGANISM="Scrippsiella trochoidea, Strain CCMP3099" /LENGTH=42 /DNA_ID= /DNA_START= /DNA_END= /DNA_ORIENTATION=
MIDAHHAAAIAPPNALGFPAGSRITTSARLVEALLHQALDER